MTRVAVFAFAALAFAPAAARADVFTFTFSEHGTTITGDLNATPNGDGTFTAVASSGVVMTDADAIPGQSGQGPASFSGLLSLVTSPRGVLGSTYGADGYTYDDQLSPGQPELINGNGLLFTLPGGDFVNLFFLGNGYEINVQTPAGSQFFYGNSGAGTFTLAAVPEPPTLPLAGLGLAAVALMKSVATRRHPLGKRIRSREALSTRRPGPDPSRRTTPGRP